MYRSAPCAVHAAVTGVKRMTRYFVLFCFALAPVLQANVDPLASPDPPLTSSELFGSSELAAGQALSETADPTVPFLLAPQSASLDEFAFNETDLETAQAGVPVFLLSVIGLPRPAEAEMSLVQTSAAYAPPQDPFNMWLLLGAASMAIVLIGGIRIIRHRRSSAAGRKRYLSSGTSGFVARNELLINESSRPPVYEQQSAPAE